MPKAGNVPVDSSKVTAAAAAKAITTTSTASAASAASAVAEQPTLELDVGNDSSASIPTSTAGSGSIIVGVASTLIGLVMMGGIAIVLVKRRRLNASKIWYAPLFGPALVAGPTDPTLGCTGEDDDIEEGGI
jgi:hypothetical protein